MILAPSSNCTSISLTLGNEIKGSYFSQPRVDTGRYEAKLSFISLSHPSLQFRSAIQLIYLYEVFKTVPELILC